MRRRALWVRAGLVAAVAAGLLVGCEGIGLPLPTETTATPTPTVSSTPTAVATAEPVLVQSKLTGELFEPAELEHPSLAAKIDNHPAARPQVGLERTDIVYEELVEGGLTRYVAVWHSDIPDEIGPIRSIRPMDPSIVSPLGGIIAYSGGQSRFVQAMRATNVFNAVHGQANTADYMYRTKDKEAPHNVIVRAAALVAAHAELAQPQRLFLFAPEGKWTSAARLGELTSTIALRFGAASTPSWQWDGLAQRWLRSQSGTPDLDSNGDQLNAANVVILQVAVVSNGGVPETQLIGGGQAWIASAGRVVEGTWSKTSLESPIQILGADGLPARLATGNTWVELVPTTGSVSFPG